MIYFMAYDVAMNHIEDFSDKNIIFNLSSPIEAIPKLKLFITSGQIPFINDKDFDIKYFNFIMTNDYAFLDLMKIIMNIHYGKDVIILIGSDRSYNYIAESLYKLIEQRYGLIPYFIYEEEDLEIMNRYINDSFSVPGLANLDMDKDRYIKLMSLKYNDKQLLNMSKYLENNFG